MSKPTRASRRAETRAAKTRTPGRATAGARTGTQRSALATALTSHPRIVVASLIALNLLFAWLTFLPQPHTGGDSANYLTLARSLLQTHTYTDLYDPIQPPHTKYPPVFPLILATGMLVGLNTWVRLKVLMALIGTAAVAFTSMWIRRRGRPVLAVGVPLLLIFSAGVLDQSHWLLSDSPFWLFTMIALWAFDRLRPNDWKRLAIAIVAAVLAYFTRSAGLPLVLAAVAWLSWRRRWKQLIAFLVVLLPLAFLWWLRAHRTGGVEYTQEFWFVDPYMPQLGKIGIGELFKRMGDNAVKYVTIHIPILLASRTNSLLTMISILLVLLGVYGWVLRLRRAMVAELMMPLYIGLLLVWPAVWSGERFFLPVMGMLLYYAALGSARLIRYVAPRQVMSIGLAVLAILIVTDVPPLNASIASGRACTGEFKGGEAYPCLAPADRSYFDAAIWTQATLPADAVVLSRKPRLFYEIAHGVRGSNYPMSQDPRVFFALADSVHARYVVYDRLTSLADYYLAPILLQRPNAFCTLKQFGQDGTMMFGIQKGASQMPDTPVDAAHAQFPACDRTFYR